MMGVLLVALVAGVVAASTFAHLSLYRWALRVWPALARFRFALAGAIVALFLWPFARPLAGFSPAPAALRAFAQFGSTWHLFVALAMAPYGLAHWGARRVARRRGRGAAAPLGPPVPPPSAAAPLGPPAPAGTGAEAALSRRRFVEAAAGGGALAASAGVLGWGLRVSRFDWRVEEVPVRLARLPRALDGFTVVQISDLHVGPLWRERELRQGLAFVAGLRPDLVVVTGDIVDHDRAYIPLAARLLGELAAREGVAFVPGNHDHYTGVREVVGALGGAGLDALVNRSKVVAARDGGGFALLGVDDMTGGYRGLGPDLGRALGSAPPGLATVLLAHQPDFFYRALRAGGVDLQLSGHTHGGQINPGFVPAGLLYEFVSGRYERQGSTIYVNRGFGTVGPPLRAGAPPEITKLVLVAG